MKKLYIGTSGYNYKHWINVFYPPGLKKKDWLPFYSKHFNTVEINATFYGSFKKEVFEKWKNTTSEDFLFSLKAPRFITHIKQLNNPEESIQRFFDSAYGLGEKFSVVLWQFPKSFKASKDDYLERFNKFIKLLPKRVRNVFEFRDTSWFDKKVYDILNKNKMGIVINDSSRLPSPEGEANGGQANFPKEEKVTGEFAYIRFHGPSSLYTSNYSDKELEIWAEKIKKILRKFDVYCYFNNDSQGFAVKNAKKLEEYLIK